jgi:uncharacterized protein YeaO (DUF488 family)
MAPIAIVVIDATPCGLLRIEPEFCITFAALNVAPNQADPGDTKTQNEPCENSDSGAPIDTNERSFHLSLRTPKQNVTIIKQSQGQQGNRVTAKRINLKRVYEEPARADGTRVLVDRLWPRGLSKARAAVDEWLRDLAPSDALRQWYHARPEAWAMFRKRYLKELARPESAEALSELYRLAKQRKKLTLLFASRNEDRNNAVVLKDLLEGMRKPPTGTGPGGIRAVRDRQAKTMTR